MKGTEFVNHETAPELNEIIQKQLFCARVNLHSGNWLEQIYSNGLKWRLTNMESFGLEARLFDGGEEGEVR